MAGIRTAAGAFSWYVECSAAWKRAVVALRSAEATRYVSTEASTCHHEKEERFRCILQRKKRQRSASKDSHAVSSPPANVSSSGTGGHCRNLACGCLCSSVPRYFFNRKDAMYKHENRRFLAIYSSGTTDATNVCSLLLGRLSCLPQGNYAKLAEHSRALPHSFPDVQ